MKSEKGITLVSLIIYVIAMLITVTIMTIVTSYFYQNVDVSAEKYTYFSEFTKFESYFSEETTKQGNRIVEINPENTQENPNAQKNSEQVYLILSSGNQYTYIKQNKAIYQNNVKITSGVEDCSITHNIENGKQTITITMKIQDKTRNMKFTLQN